VSFARRHAVPFAAGLAAATAAFAVIALTSGGGEAVQTGPSSEGLAVFNRMGCGGCHELAAAGSSGPIAPNLDQELPGHTRDSLRVAILTPPAGGMMPEDFGERMSEDELESLIDFLLASR
jgi:mono/diheme cytochrome c family protein